MAAASPAAGRVDDPLQEVQTLQRDLKAFARAVNRPLRDHVVLTPQDVPNARRALPTARNPRDEELVDRLKFVKALPGKNQTSALVRQALCPQDENSESASVSLSTTLSQKQRKAPAAQSARQQSSPTLFDKPAATALDFQDQLYDSSGAIDLTRVKLKIQQHQQDLIAAGLHVPLAELDLSPSPEKQPQNTAQGNAQPKLRWQNAAGQPPAATSSEYTLSQHERRNATPKVWIHKRKLWEDEEAESTSYQENVLLLQASPQAQPSVASHHLQQPFAPQLPGQSQRLASPTHQPHHAPGHLHPPAGHPQSPGRSYTRQHSFFSRTLPHTQSSGHLLSQPSLPKPGSKHLHESRQDHSAAAHQALLDEEAERMLRHLSPDGSSCHASRLLRTPQHLTPLITACGSAAGLQTLDLSHNNLSDSALIELEALDGKANLADPNWRIAHTGHKFSSTKSFLPTAVVHAGLVDSGANLTSLNLAHNKLKLTNAAPLPKILQGAGLRHAQLHQLVSSQQPAGTIPLPQQGDAALAAAGLSSSLDPHDGDSAAAQALDTHAVAASAPSNTPVRHASVAGPSLQHLELSHNPLGDHGLKALVGACEHPRLLALIQLGLEGCGLGCLCPAPVATILQNWTSLRQLTLSWNDLGFKGALAVAQALQVNHHLLTLELAHCGLTDMGGAQIALSLAANRSLQGLDLSSNQLEAATCAALSHVLPTECRLLQLCLDNNPLGKQGAAELMQAIAATSACSLQRLQLLGCGLADNAFIQHAIQQRAAEATEQVKTPKKKKKKGAKGKEKGKDKADDKKKKKDAPAAKAAPAAKPGGEHYSLNLEQPTDWAAVLGLIQAVKSGKVVWKNLVLAGKKKAGPLPPEQWPVELPISGLIEFDTKPVAAKTDATAGSPLGSPATPGDGFCSLLGPNLDSHSTALDDWRLQLLEVLPAAGIQLTESQALKLARSFPGLLEGLLRSEDQDRALTALGACCQQLPLLQVNSTPGSG